MPSIASLNKAQYYGHPANLFWPILADVFGFSPTAPYPSRIGALRAAGVALWDVLRACEREGSGDAAIVSATEKANAIDELLATHHTIRRVLLNGHKASTAFQKHIAPQINDDRRMQLDIQRLPSTSPANASVSRIEKFARWSAALTI